MCDTVRAGGRGWGHEAQLQPTLRHRDSRRDGLGQAPLRAGNCTSLEGRAAVGCSPGLAAWVSNWNGWWKSGGAAQASPSQPAQWRPDPSTHLRAPEKAGVTAAPAPSLALHSVICSSLHPAGAGPLVYYSGQQTARPSHMPRLASPGPPPSMFCSTRDPPPPPLPTKTKAAAQLSSSLFP